VIKFIQYHLFFCPDREKRILLYSALCTTISNSILLIFLILHSDYSLGLQVQRNLQELHSQVFPSHFLAFIGTALFFDV
jgi:hypothetical protein